MNAYTLTAKLAGAVNIVTIHAESADEAIIEAAFKVLKAAPRSRLWSHGSIELRDSDGNLLTKMESKVRDREP